MALGWIDEKGDPTPEAAAGFKTPEAGRGHRRCGRRPHPSWPARGGLYLEDCDIAEPATEEAPGRGVRDYAVDADAAARLWAVSAERTGVDAFA